MKEKGKQQKYGVGLHTHTHTQVYRSWKKGGGIQPIKKGEQMDKLFEIQLLLKLYLNDYAPSTKTIR
jgi:hypothetical protein